VSGSLVQIDGTLTLLARRLSGRSEIRSQTRASPVAAPAASSVSPHLCTAADRVYAVLITPTTEGLVKPGAILPYWYENASPGPGIDCTTGSFPSGFDTPTP
jgi:hypothetical protein